MVLAASIYSATAIAQDVNISVAYDGLIYPLSLLDAIEDNVATTSASFTASATAQKLSATVFVVQHSTAIIVLGEFTAKLAPIVRSALVETACGALPPAVPSVKLTCRGVAVKTVTSAAAQLWFGAFSTEWTVERSESFGNAEVPPSLSEGLLEALLLLPSAGNVTAPTFRRRFEASFAELLALAVAEGELGSHAAAKAKSGAVRAVFSDPTTNVTLSFHVGPANASPVVVLFYVELGVGVAFLVLALVAAAALAWSRVRKMTQVLATGTTELDKQAHPGPQFCAHYPIKSAAAIIAIQEGF